MSETTTKKRSLFPGAKAIHEMLRGTSPHKLRLRIVRLDAEVHNLRAEIERLESENRGLRSRLQNSVSSADVAEIHQRSVALERENGVMIDLLRELKASVAPAITGEWVIGDVGDLPPALQNHFATINEVRAAAQRIGDLNTALLGFAELWARVEPQIKRRILAECDRDGVKTHMSAVTHAAKHVGSRYEKKRESPTPGNIVAFNGDRF